jgi:Tfp pilus assembly protein PilF
LFERALAVALEQGASVRGAAHFNLACAHAEAGNFTAAATALQAAIKIDPKYREDARTDNSFRAARKDPEFKRILE